jgi:hypothetical protein
VSFLRSIGSGLILPPGVDDVVVIVNKDQPSSIIAYTLSSIEYRDKLGAAAANADVRFSLVLHTHTHCVHPTLNACVLFLRWDVVQPKLSLLSPDKFHIDNSTSAVPPCQ